MLKDPAGDRPHAHDTTGDADDCRVVRYRMNDNGAGADFHVVADLNTAENLSARSDNHVIADGRMALAVLVARATERDALIAKHVVADLGGFADHYSHAVIDEKAPADFRAGV